MNTIILDIFSIDTKALNIFNFISLSYFALSIVLLLIAKWIRDLLTSYKLETVLTKDDNPALGISFAGYLFSCGYIIASVVGAPSISESGTNYNFIFTNDLIQTALWSFIGILLLNASVMLNNHFILPAFSNKKEIIEDRNIGVGACQAASYFASALIIAVIVSGPYETTSFIKELTMLVLFFLFAHAAMALFAVLFRKTASYDVNRLMEADNAAAGLSLGAHLVAISIVFSGALIVSNSLFYIAAIFINGSVFILIIRSIFDKIIFKKSNIAKEISEDNNWAIAICQGAIAISTALLLNNIF